LAIAACAASLFGFAPRANAATLADPAWSSSSPTTGAADASYTYAFTVATSASLTSVTMTVPAGTAGTAAVGTVSPDPLTGGSIALVGATLTYSFIPTAIPSDTTVSIQVNGLTNTATAGSYTAAITTSIRVFTGSISSVTASSAPSSSCLASCTLPSDTVTYPVAITTAPSSPPAATIYDTPAGSGAGSIIVGGNSAADPAGWWINVPASTLFGTYTSTVALTISSGP
jgi:hypothetical protein